MPTESMIEYLLGEATRAGAEFMDVRINERTGTRVSVQDGRADEIYSSKVFGAGIRVLIDGMWGFASTNILERDELSRCLKEAASMARAAKGRALERGEVAEPPAVRGRAATPVRRDPRDVDVEQKVKAVFELEKAARTLDPRMVNTIVGYGESILKETVANTYGVYAESEAVRTIVSCFVTAKEGDLRQSAVEIRGGLKGFELLEGLDPEAFSVTAAKKALGLLKAEKAPAGRFPVVFNPAVTGLFAHEAIGHNAEADGVWAGMSILEGKVGQQVAAETVSIYDDATIEGAYGSYAYDSEGVPGQRKCLVKDGVLQGFMHSLETAKKFEAAPTGSARADGHQSRPIVRMSNTYIAPGEWSFEEIIRETREGILLKGGYWGYVFVERGQFTCNAEEAWTIKNGELKEHLRNVSVSGLTLEALQDIDAVSKDFELKLPGICGKGGQGMYVDGGGPYLRVKQLVVGGQR
ncbi:MAG: TldD/PmbA family protein [Candidatus Bathyarchaeia archaeon]